MKKRSLILLLVVGFLLVFGGFWLTQRSDLPKNAQAVSLSDARNSINNGRVQTVIQQGNKLYLIYKDKGAQYTYIESGVNLVNQGIDTAKVKLEQRK